MNIRSQEDQLFITRLRRYYYNMVKRCANPNHPQYVWYGSRGVQMKFKDFNEFMVYVTDVLWIINIEQLQGRQIHRLDNNSHYMPGNIVFLTDAEHRAVHVELRRLAKLSTY